MEPESSLASYYETLQVSPSAEPEVIAAAYKALARKYHPDRSNAPDTISRMAKVNIAYQALSRPNDRPSHSAQAVTKGDWQRPLTTEHIDLNAPLEDSLKIVAKKALTARQKLVSELVKDGLQHNTAIDLANQAFESIAATGSRKDNTREPLTTEHLNVNTSLEDAMKVTSKKASVARQRVVDELTKDGLQSHMATDLADQAFESIAVTKSRKGNTREPLTTEHLNVGASLEDAIKVARKKAGVARQRVADELTKDGLQSSMAMDLVNQAFASLIESGT
jgi:hypothetical protein